MNETVCTAAGYENVLWLFAARTGLWFRPDQREATFNSIRRVMDRAGMQHVHEYARLLEHDNESLDDLIAELTVGETYFFREPAQFDYIRGEILPEVRRRRGHEHVIRIWSAGCASGEEAYSLAILCAQEGVARHSHILATDICSVALAKARDASYREWSLRGKGAATPRKYLKFDGGRYHVDERIRRQVQFEFLNLALDVYPSLATGTRELDLILCRNVMIYFNQQTIREVARRLYDSLADGGYLITSSGDPPIEKYADYETLVTDAGVFYRRPLREKTLAAFEQPQVTASWPDAGQPEPNVAADPVQPRDRATAQPVVPFAPVPPGTPDAATDSLAGARAELEQGRYDRAVKLTEGHVSNPDTCVVRVKALANIDILRAMQGCAEAVERHPLSAELHYLHAVLLMELNLDADAAAAAQRAVFLDRSLAIAHFTLGSILRRRGALEGAQRHFRNARELCENRPPDESVPLAEGETARQLAAAAELQLTTVGVALGR